MSDGTGRSMAQVALAWLRYRSGPVIPIIGARKLSQLQDNLASFDVTLSADQVKKTWSAVSATAVCETGSWPKSVERLLARAAQSQ